MFLIMLSNRRRLDEDVTEFSSPERILGHGRRIAFTSSATTLVGNPPITSQSLKAAIKEVTTPVPRAGGEDSFDGLPDRPVSEECPTLEIRPTQAPSLVDLEKAMRE